MHTRLQRKPQQMKLTLPQSTSFPIAGMRGDDNCNCIAFFNEKQAFRTKRSYLSTNGQNFAIRPDKRQKNNKPVSICLPAYLVGVRRLELLASCSLSKRATNLRYTPLLSCLSFLRKWSEWGDLNSRPLAPEASALPNCATPRRFSRLDYYILKLLVFQ